MISTRNRHTILLDTQVSKMPQLLEVIPERGHQRQSSLLSQGWEVLLPIEVIQQIVSHIPHEESRQKLLWTCCLISRAWYSAIIELLYERPYLNGGNFAAFVTTVCPSKNAHVRRSPLATYVKRLDMGHLAHNGNKSLTARVLGRVKGNLAEFIAPQASFSINSLAALSKCTSLTYLDLFSISAGIPANSLFKAISGLTELKTLLFPRASDRSRHKGQTESWPPKLESLHLAGGIDDYFVHHYMLVMPGSLKRLSIRHCPRLDPNVFLHFLVAIGPQLRHFTFVHPMIQFNPDSMDGILRLCTGLDTLHISADYISHEFFKIPNITLVHPLQTLYVECRENAFMYQHIDLGLIQLSLNKGLLPQLRRIKVSEQLLLDDEVTTTELTDLVDLLEDREKKKPLGIEVGVWTMHPKHWRSVQ